VRPVWFPRVASLAALAAHAQANRARFLYFSWYEGKLRPEFWYLLDTSAVVPGLTRIASVLAPAAVLYRIEPGFGADPDWMADSTERMVHVARGEIRVLEDTDAFTIRSFLGRRSRLAGRWEDALVHFEAMTRGRPNDTRGWVYSGDALVALGRLGAARGARRLRASACDQPEQPRRAARPGLDRIRRSPLGRGGLRMATADRRRRRRPADAGRDDRSLHPCRGRGIGLARATAAGRRGTLSTVSARAGPPPPPPSRAPELFIRRVPLRARGRVLPSRASSGRWSRGCCTGGSHYRSIFGGAAATGGIPTFRTSALNSATSFSIRPRILPWTASSSLRSSL